MDGAQKSTVNPKTLQFLEMDRITPLDYGPVNAKVDPGAFNYITYQVVMLKSSI
jgi:hypothetical protein